MCLWRSKFERAFKELSLNAQNDHTLFESLEEKKEKGGSDVILLKEITSKVGHEEIGPNITIEDLIRVAAGLLPKHNDIPSSNQPSSAAL